jgi:hypothetical protein
MIIDNEENVEMDETIKGDDVLTTVENLSQDLSAIATAPKEESEEISSQEEASVSVESKNVDLISVLSAALQAAQEANEQSIVDVLSSKIEDLKKTQEDASLVEAPTAENAEQSPNEEKESEGEKVEAEEQEVVVVDPANAETPAETEEQEESKVELTDEVKADEQDTNDEVNKLQALQEENAKLKEALHRTLAERVVDTKISLGTESVESREELIIDHTKRSAGSLADSLRDLAKLPVAKKNIQKLNESIIENDIVLEEENNVILEDEEVETAPQAKVDTVEELFVDAFMGRRKL